MKIAFYKSTSPGISGLFNVLTRFWTRSIYSHCEAVMSDDLSIPAICSSSSHQDSGVRTKLILLDPNHWDIIEVPDISQERVGEWFERHLGEKYDTIGLLSIFSPVENSRKKWFCSEAIATAAGYKEGWRLSPATLYDLCLFEGGTLLTWSIK